MNLPPLDKLKYIIMCTHSSKKEQEYYLAGVWGESLNDNKLAEAINDGCKIGIHDDIYYTTDLALAKIFAGAEKAKKKVSLLTDDDDWAFTVKPISGEKVFRAQLKGPERIKLEKQVEDSFWNIVLLDGGRILLESPLGCRYNVNV